MKASLFRNANQNGLTLLEIIVTLTIASVLGTVIVLYMNTSLIQSAESISPVQNTYALNLIVEQVTADYKKLLDTDSSSSLTNLKTNIQNGIYGQYDIQQLDFIAFDEDNNNIEISPDPSGDNRVLKATITANDQSVTVLFTK